MTQGKQKVALIINSASYERVCWGLNLASVAAALGKDVYVLFGYGGLIRLKRDSMDKVGEETDSWIREQIKLALRRGGVSKISELLTSLQRLGGKVYACPGAMALHNLLRDDLIGELDGVRGLAEFLREDAKEALIMYV